MEKELKTTLLIPVLNEINGMKEIMPQIDPNWVDQILILDGGSADGSIGYAQSSGWEIYIQQRKGLRRAYIDVFDKIKGDIVVTFSPDGNSLPELIPQLISKIKEGYDLVIASRYLAHARSLDDDAITKIGNWAFTFMISTFFGYPYTDAMVILRAWRKDVIKELEINKEIKFPPKWEDIIGVWVSWEPMISMRFARRRKRIIEIPADEPKRIQDVRKMKPFKTGLAVLIQLVQEAVFWW